MKINCPNINTKEWKELGKDLGKDRAYLAYFRHDKGIPSPEQARDLLDAPKFMRQEKENEPGLNLRLGNTIKKGVPVEGEAVKIPENSEPVLDRKPKEEYGKAKITIKTVEGKDITPKGSPVSIVTARILQAAGTINKGYNE